MFEEVDCRIDSDFLVSSDEEEEDPDADKVSQSGDFENKITANTFEDVENNHNITTDDHLGLGSVAKDSELIPKIKSLLENQLNDYNVIN